MATEAARPNYFLLLGIDPDAAWDDGEFERALADRKKTWTKARGGIGTKPATIAAKENFGRITHIQQTMRDPAAREQERVAARAATETERQRRVREVARTLDILLAKGF